MKKNESNKNNSPILDETLPHISNFPSFKNSGKKMEKPFINEHGVVIGDSKYNSKESPLNNWSEGVDPSIMAGEEWIHPTNDIGCATEENSQLLEEMKREPSKQFMHPQKETRD